MSRKTFCDRCDKEIAESERVVNVPVKSVVHELCEGCHDTVMRQLSDSILGRAIQAPQPKSGVGELEPETESVVGTQEPDEAPVSE